MSSSHNPTSSSPDSNNDPWSLLIGEITAPMGLKGEVRVYPHTDHPERFETLREVGLRQGTAPVRVVRVLSARVQERRISLRLEGVESIDAAEALRGTQLVVPQSQRAPLEADEYHYADLLGMEVVTTEGEALGKIIEIYQTGANDVYETPLALIPAVKEFVREVDVPQRRMLVQAVPGLKKNDPGA